ncbi:chaperone protein DNAJ [Perkinsela sp. CCAP 1560/4]|nr:chaperone protein DNAJ [Perkinsela sp. CCAP 1560/4]|eukprot:KNH06412.1 chaperone protein DNAJ [Perkinsela sp. CCAP 1560/4]
MRTWHRLLIPLRLRLEDFSHRLDVEWDQMLHGIPMGSDKLRTFLRTYENGLSSFSRDISDYDNSLFRRAPIHPWLRINSTPQRQFCWGCLVAFKNFWNAIFLSLASLICFFVSEAYWKAIFRPCGYIIFASVVNPLLLLWSGFNTWHASENSLRSTSIRFFDPFKGIWTTRDTYSNRELQMMKSNIHTQGRLFFLLRQSASSSNQGNLVGLAHYETLGLQRNANSKEIGEAYKRLKQTYSFGGKSSRIFDINEAFAVLGDPEKRKLYDEGGEGAVVTRGTNPLFLGFCNPYSSAHRKDLREFIGGPLITTWFTGDPYFGHMQLRNLDRIQISASEFEMLLFIRAGHVCDSLYHRVLKHSLDMEEHAFVKVSAAFVRRYILTSPLGAYIAFMLGEIYIACANDFLKGRWFRSNAKELFYLQMMKAGVRMWQQFQAYRAGNQSTMGKNTLLLQLDALEVDICHTIHTAVNRLFIQISDIEQRKCIARALNILGTAMRSNGRKWDDIAELNINDLRTQMNSQAAHWRRVDLSTISFVS